MGHLRLAARLMCQAPLSCVAAWLSGVVSSWLWELPPEPLRVALLVLARSRAEGDDRVTTMTSSEIAVACRTSRPAVRRALKALADGGWCKVETRAGHDGVTVIRVSTVKRGVDISAPLCAGHLDVVDIVVEGLRLEGSRGHLERAGVGHLERAGSAHETGGFGGAAGQLAVGGDLVVVPRSPPKAGVNLRSPVDGSAASRPPDRVLSSLVESDPDPDLQPPETTPSPLVRLRTSEVAQGLGGGGEAEEPVLSATGDKAGGRGRSPRRGLAGAEPPRGSGSDSGSGSPPAGASTGSQLSLLGEPTFDDGPVVEPVASRVGGLEDDDPEYEARQREILKRIGQRAIPDRAFAAADWMRAYVVNRYPYAYIARRPWGKERLNDRLVWASQLAVIAEPKPVGIDGRGWSEVARVVKWLFEEQLASERPFVVQSPKALREKWGNIQAAMARSRHDVKRKAPQPASGRVFQSWDDGWPSSGGDRG